MKIKRAPPRTALILNVEEHRRVAQFVGLLVTIGRRNALQKRNKVPSSKKDKGVRDYREPCFFDRTFYHGHHFSFIQIMTMIDKIVLTLTRDQYHIVEPDNFSPSVKSSYKIMQHYNFVAKCNHETLCKVDLRITRGIEHVRHAEPLLF